MGLSETLFQTGLCIILQEAKMLIDSHVHVGQYFDIYTSPQDLLTFLNSVEVSCAIVSSTTICEQNYKRVIDEFKELKRISSFRVLPMLWVTPEMLENRSILDDFLNAEIPWRGIKIHPQLNPHSWLTPDGHAKSLILLARLLKAPILIHTGEMDGCYPAQYIHLFEYYKDVTFILAHGRPINETIDIMKVYSNIWTDTAFMPIENIKKLCKAKLTDRILWGTDYPIPKYFYPQVDMLQYYRNLIEELHNTVSDIDFQKITYKNFIRLFG